MKRLTRHLFHFILITFHFQVATSASIDSLYTTIPDDEEQLVEIAEAWEEMSMPDNRVRFYLPEWRNRAHPSYNLKSRLQSEHYSIGFLLQRDQGESRLDDLSRFYLSINQPDYDLIIGDFHLDHGLGWTISSRFHWMNGYSNNHSRFSGNLSTEEGQGFRGGTINFRNLKVSGLFNFCIATWLGFTPYDIYAEKENGVVFFSEQGNHLHDYSRLDERLIGSTINLSLPGYPATIGFIVNRSDFHEPISPDQPARFRYLSQDNTSYGITGKLGKEKQFAFEATVQDQGATAIAVNSMYYFTGTYMVVDIYRASKNLISLHARPNLAFSGTGSGKTGFQSKVGFQVDPRMEVDLSSRIELTEPTLETIETRKFRADLGCCCDLSDGYKFSCRAISYMKWEKDQTTTDLRILRSNLEIPHVDNRLCFRFEAQTNNHKPGALVSIKYIVRPIPALGIQLTTTYLNEAGEEISLMVVEPGGPGVFPIRMLGGKQLRQAFSISLKSYQNIQFWCSGFVAHRIGEMSDNTSDEIRLGFEWFIPGKQHGR